MQTIKKYFLKKRHKPVIYTLYAFTSITCESDKNKNWNTGCEHSCHAITEKLIENTPHQNRATGCKHSYSIRTDI